MSTDKLIEKVQKLLTLARNEGASEAEADTALKMANKILLIHNLTMSDIDIEQQDDNGLIQKDNVIDICQNGEEGQWESTLMAVLCEYNLCGCISHSTKGTNKGTITIVGSQQNIEVVIYLFQAARDLYRALSKTRHSTYRKSVIDQWKAKGYVEKDLYAMETENGSRMLLRRSVWIRSYLKGCVTGLFHKLESQKLEMIQQEDAETQRVDSELRIQAILKAESEGTEYIEPGGMIGTGKMELMIIDIKEKIQQKIEASFEDIDIETEVKNAKAWKIDPKSDAYNKGLVDGQQKQIARAIN
jgi:hypothetical protein